MDQAINYHYRIIMNQHHSRDSSQILEEPVQNQDDHFFSQENLLIGRCRHGLRECDLVTNLLERHDENRYLVQGGVNEELHPLKRYGCH